MLLWYIVVHFDSFNVSWALPMHGMQRSDYTSSSAVAKRPRDASCLSVVSFNCTKRRVESFIVSYVRYRFITACS